MITLDRAKEIALHYLNVDCQPKVEVALFEDEIKEFEEGYLLPFGAKKYIVDGDEGYRVSGVSPLIVNKKTGEIFSPTTSTCLPDEELIQLFQEELKSK